MRKGPHEGGHHGPHLSTDDEFQLGARLSYVLMLMRRGDAGMRRGGHRRGGGFQGQGRILRLLALQSPIAQKELAYVLGIRSQSLAEQIGKLEADGLVTRKPDPNDGRTHVVDLTEQGRKLAATQQEQTPADPFEVLESEEKEQLADLLDKVIAGMEAQLPEGPDARMQRFKHMTFEGGPEEFGSRGGRHGRGGRGNRPPRSGRNGPVETE